jgi:hypothetical protein
MGVRGLWGIMRPGIRRVPVSQLAGQRLAVDLAIWVVEVMVSLIRRTMNRYFRQYLGKAARGSMPSGWPPLAGKSTSLGVATYQAVLFLIIIHQ